MATIEELRQWRDTYRTVSPMPYRWDNIDMLLKEIDRLNGLLYPKSIPENRVSSDLAEFMKGRKKIQT